MSVGVCYFPEQWPRERWETDVEAMAEAGLEYVRMAEFSWAVLEPERGDFDFEWLDRAVELIGEHGMEAVLCTPTATPPKWLVDERPEILQAEPDGTPRAFGSRRHYCFNSDAYREETRRIVEKLADHYADNPHVAGWQTDNEFGCHDTVRCYCDDCSRAFSEWLAERYEHVEELNTAWGNTFWSQRYNDFEAVDPPRHTAAEHHPSRLLEYYRFANDSVVEYNRLQADLLRERNDDWFITHNFMGRFDSLDAYSVSEDLDLVSWDSYPTGFVQDRLEDGHQPTPDQLRAGDPDQVGMDHDIYRSALDRPFWVMEQQPGDVNWPPHCPQPGDGAMRLWAHHAVAHGADAVLYFRWRRAVEGQEQYHAGLRKQDGSPDRGYEDATQTASEFENVLADGLDHVDAPVAVLHDYDNLWALSEQPHAPDFEYWNLLDAFYSAFRARGVQVDVVHPSSDLSGYDIVAAPALHLVTDALAARLTDFVETGGEVLFGPRSGVKDAYNKLQPRLQPGPLTDLVGARIDQHESLPPHLESCVTHLETGTNYEYRTWGEWLEPTTASPLLEYDGTTGGVACGRPAAVVNDERDGTVTYCGVWPEADLADALVEPILERAAVDYSSRLPDGVRVGARDGYTWVTNFSSDRYRIRPASETTPVIGGLEIDGFDVTVVEGDAVDDLSVVSLE
ncbi:beta-galactosidase [Natrialbaceae archaeon A-chndr2]|uniref:beta-galactosidase n=1 Tax=Natronosalvus amylolyticus TaxID=2961994 RepID=UPI0020C9CD0A|nr:beta-galactosidase [Natronosalvus amylolyticus]